MNSSRLVLTAFPLVLIALSGCYGDKESFAKAAAKQSCKRLAECNRSVFDNQYKGDMDRCSDDVRTDLLDGFDALEALGCDYDPDQGRECIKVAKQLNNECSTDSDQDIGDACEEVFDCPGIPLPRTDPPGPDDTIATHIVATLPLEELEQQ